MRREFIALYWTLPVKWASFYDLPRDLNAAAARSTTIRYQRERVRRWVSTDGAPGAVVEHIHYVDVQPDRATDVVIEKLRPITTACRSGEKTLVFVNFALSSRWRTNRPLMNYVRDNKLHHEAIPPDQVPLDGKPDFDIIEHFRQWKKRDGQRTERRERALLALIAADDRVPRGPHHAAIVARTLNAREEYTSTGQRWTAANVSQTLYRSRQAFDGDTA